eukprot:gene7803-1398_t
MGKRVGNYELGKTLGKGKFSKVVYGVDVNTKQDYAVKIIEKSALLADGKWEAALRREVGIMKKLRHRNIVSLTDVLQTKTKYLLVMELITGGELFDHIVTSKRLDEDRARLYLQQLIAGLHHCHKLGIAHRDLKPENLLISNGDTLKISDFGLSNLQFKDQVLTTVCGTPNYVAPEVILNQYNTSTGALKSRAERTSWSGYDGFASDVWSVGVIMYVMLAGWLPFDDDHLAKLFVKIEKGDYHTPPFISEEAQFLIRNLLVVDPAKRFTLQQAVSTPWLSVGLDASALELQSLTQQQRQELQEKLAQKASEHAEDVLKHEVRARSAPCALITHVLGPCCVLGFHDLVHPEPTFVFMDPSPQQEQESSGNSDPPAPELAEASPRTALAKPRTTLSICSKESETRFVHQIGREKACAQFLELLPKLGCKPASQTSRDGLISVRGTYSGQGLLDFCVEFMGTGASDLTVMECASLAGAAEDFTAFCAAVQTHFKGQ